MKPVSFPIRFAAASLLLVASVAFAQSGTSSPAVASAAFSSGLSAEEAVQRLRLGEDLERRRDARGAFAAYLEAAEAGNGLAQKKLSDLYSTGTPAVERNYETALRWYHKAREQGIEIPKPFNYPGSPIGGLPR